PGNNGCCEWTIDRHGSREHSEGHSRGSDLPWEKEEHKARPAGGYTWEQGRSRGSGREWKLSGGQWKKVRDEVGTEEKEEEQKQEGQGGEREVRPGGGHAWGQGVSSGPGGEWKSSWGQQKSVRDEVGTEEKEEEQKKEGQVGEREVRPGGGHAWGQGVSS
ncbi:unnamed protein product, partial [Discosporangium mesarthrocarpum]